MSFEDPPGPAPHKRRSASEPTLPWEAPPRDEGVGSTGVEAEWHDNAQKTAFQEIKSRVHRRLLERLNLSNLDSIDKLQVIAAIRKVLHELLAEESTPLNFEEREELVGQVLDEIFGLGPLEPLLKDPDIADILVNTFNQVYVERNGKLEQVDVRFQDDKHLLQVIDRIVSGIGRRIDESSPMVDARLPDGSRVHAIVPPVALDGPHLSIRKFKREALAAEDLVRTGALSAGMLELLKGIVHARLNIVVSGGTGAGKTTLLNVLSSYVPEDQRIITIEDSAELQLRQPHVVRLETRPPNLEGKGEITQRQLVKNALRMRPDRIILGECRGEEAVDMLQAMNTGHNGSITTLHANASRDALSRLEVMVSMANLGLPDRVVRRQIASAIHVIIQLMRLSDGTRKVVAISEVVGVEEDIITMQDIFTYERHGVADDGRVLGRFQATGIRPRFADRLHQVGIELPTSMFSLVPPAAGSSW
jgi:pilus assembly protein CpaF